MIRSGSNALFLSAGTLVCGCAPGVDLLQVGDHFARRVEPGSIERDRDVVIRWRAHVSDHRRNVKHRDLLDLLGHDVSVVVVRPFIRQPSRSSKALTRCAAASSAPTKFAIRNVGLGEHVDGLADRAPAVLGDDA